MRSTVTTLSRETGPAVTSPAVQRPTGHLMQQPRSPPPVHHTSSNSSTLLSFPLARPVVSAPPHTPRHGDSSTLPGARHANHLSSVDARHSAGLDDSDESGGRQLRAHDECFATSACSWDAQRAAVRRQATSSAVQRHPEEESGATHGSGEVRPLCSRSVVRFGCSVLRTSLHVGLHTRAQVCHRDSPHNNLGCTRVGGERFPDLGEVCVVCVSSCSV